MTNSSVTFSAQDNGVSGFMNKMKQSSQDLTSQILRDSARQKQSAKELLKLAEEKIKSLEKTQKLESLASQNSVQQWSRERKDRAEYQLENLRRGYKDQYNNNTLSREDYRKRLSRLDVLGARYSPEGIDKQASERSQSIKEQSRQSSLLVKLMMMNIDAIRQASKEQVSAVKSGDAKITDTINNEGLDANQNNIAQRAALEELTEGKSKSSLLRRSGSQLLSLANAMTIDRVGGMIAAMPSSRNELDFARPLMSLAGMTVGGMTGIGLDALTGTKILGTGLGQTNFASLGIQLGSKAGEFFGSAIERTFRGRDELSTQQFKTQALTGRFTGGDSNRGIDLSRFGLSYRDAAALQTSMSSSKGRFVDSGELNHIQALESGYGVSSGSVQSMMELVRSNAWSDRYVPSIIAGIKQGLFGSGDRTYLNEFITRNYAGLQKALITSQNSVSSGSILSISKGLSGLGGQWDMKHSNAPGLWEQVQSSLSNPGSDAAKALGFHIMRKKNPNMSLLDIQMEMQKGLTGGGGTYLQNMLEYVKGQGGDESYQVNNIASIFGLQNNLAAAKSLYQGKGLPSSFKSFQLSGGLGEAEGLGVAQTSRYTRSTAEIENAFIDSAINGIGTMKDKMAGLFGNMMAELSIMVKQMIRESFGGSSDTEDAERDRVYNNNVRTGLEPKNPYDNTPFLDSATRSALHKYGKRLK